MVINFYHRLTLPWCLIWVIWWIFVTSEFMATSTQSEIWVFAPLLPLVPFLLDQLSKQVMDWNNVYMHIQLHTVFFLKSAPGAFEFEIKLCFLTLQLAPSLYCRGTVIQSIFFMKGYQNAKFDSKWRYSLHISVWKSLKLAHYVVLYHHFTQYFCSNLFWKV